MLRKLKTRFILLAMAVLFVVLAVTVSGMNIINYNSVIHEADKILNVISRNKGDFPSQGNEPNRLPQNMSPETPYESRFFTVILSSSGKVIKTDTSRIKAINDETAEVYAENVLKSNKSRGFERYFRFVSVKENDQIRMTFYDCGRRLKAFYSFLTASLIMALVGYAIASFAIFFCSGRLIRPIAEGYKKQKQFVTDAGHEIKTPLTIINANVDVLEMEMGQNESLSDIKQQISRLISLTNDLVMLARMEESKETLQKIEFPISKVVAETAMPFRVLANKQGKEFTCDIEPALTYNGNEKAVQKLVSILMDNAVKYSPENGSIFLTFKRQFKSLCLTVVNTTAEEITQENLSQIFDRFYRTDTSRNSETGGYGIGLSIASAITAAHGGKIQVLSDDGRTFKISVILPI